jgi:hypothetical protein
LCNRIKSEWWKFVDQRNFFEPIELEEYDGTSLPPDNPPQHPGIYGIFAHLETSAFPLCFYVGISTTDVRARLRNHLGIDIRENYRSSFRCLGESDEIFICSSTVPDLGLEERNRNRQKLALLEYCLTVLLRPRFLLLAAMNT